MLNQQAVTHDPRAGLTPSQLSEMKATKARRARFSVAPAVHIVPHLVEVVAPVEPDAAPPLPAFKEPWFSIVYEMDENGENRPRVDEIIRVVCRHFNVGRSDILSPRRTAPVVHARHVAMYLAKTLTIKSLPEIGRRMDRDHTTVLSGVRKIAALLESGYADLLADIAAMTNILLYRDLEAA